jgi:hypothetical protein
MDREAPKKSPSVRDRPPPGIEEPRLRIIHLIVGITCVAVYLGAMQTPLIVSSATFDEAETSVLFKAMLLFSCLGAGIALGGPCLLVARLVRRAPFPIHPGEYLLVLWGVNSVVFLAASSSALFPEYPLWWMFVGPFRVIGALICLWAANLAEAGRWRGFFLLMAGVQVMGCLLCCLGPIVNVQDVLFSVVLAVIVVRDHWQGLRYPWTHWLGVGLQVWFTLATLGWLAALIFLWQIDLWRPYLY